MNNEMYLIHKDDYINHIDNQIRLYVMVKQLAVNIKRLAPNRGSKKITVGRHPDRYHAERQRPAFFP